MSKYNLKKLLNRPSRIYEQFHEKTKIRVLKRILSVSLWPKEWTETLYKEYLRLDRIVLPDPIYQKSYTLEQSLINRISSRLFTKKPVSLDCISTLLYFSAGLKKNSQGQKNKRFYPSAGARYPLEVYLISLNSEIPSAIYHYAVRSHSLEIIQNHLPLNIMKNFNYPYVKKASFLILITACFERTVVKYSDRGYRYILFETGHLAQNFYLNCSALELDCTAVDDYLEDGLNRMLDLDGSAENVIYVLAIGNKN